MVILDRMAGVAVMRRRAGGEISRQLTAFVLQSLLLGGELKIHASEPLRPAVTYAMLRATSSPRHIAARGSPQSGPAAADLSDDPRRGMPGYVCRQGEIGLDLDQRHRGTRSTRLPRDGPQQCARDRADDAGYSPPTISPATRTLTLSAFPGR